MTPEERARAIMPSPAKKLSRMDETRREIARALHDYGDERLEEAAVLASLQQDSICSPTWNNCAAGIAAKIRLLKKGKTNHDT